MIAPRPAPVRPRITVPDGSGPRLLQDEVQFRIEAKQPGLIELIGPPGCGKSTALADLAVHFGAHPFLALADRPDSTALSQLASVSPFRLVVYTSDRLSPPDNANIERWRVAPWTRDECIEYLLAVHPAQCASVMRRVLADAEWSWLDGAAELCRTALDRMAQDESLTGARTALWNDLLLRLPTQYARQCAGAWGLHMVLASDAPLAAVAQMASAAKIEAEIRLLLRHPTIQMLLAADYVAGHVSRDPSSDLLSRLLPEPLLREAAARIRDDPQAVTHLQAILDSREVDRHAMAASLLHAAGCSWKPSGRLAPHLAAAHLPGLQWHGIDLVQLDISGADLTGADFSESKLTKVTANRTELCQARLHGASLTRFVATGALFDGADLSFVRAPNANFRQADLQGASLEGAKLTGASFEGALLQGTCCRRADLKKASFRGAVIDNADFSGANLSRANLSGVVLRVAEFAGAQFPHAELVGCDLEFMLLPGGNFDHADLREAHLTGSQMPNANFQGADLRDTGLAEIEWERADLRRADLRGSTFHLGSSRSGLVGSPIASEGSRTGFYTDELHEQGFKSPEEIRKANLCGADLCGANIEGVDFYLVDLRGARYSEDQEVQFRQCGAILETRV